MHIPQTSPIKINVRDMKLNQSRLDGEWGREGTGGRREGEEGVLILQGVGRGGGDDEDWRR